MTRSRRFVAPFLVSAAAALAGCGAAHNASTAGITISKATAKPPAVPSVPAGTRPVQLLTWNLNMGEPLTLDSGKVVNFDDEFVLANLCEPLEKLLPNGKVEPELATSIKQTSSTSYVIEVRHGVKFWNGQPMTASDVAFTLQRQLNPSEGSYFMALLGGAFKSATATGKYEVTVQLNRPTALFVPMLETPLSMVVEKSFAQAHGSSYGTPQVGPMCTGAYEFSNWTPGQNITIKRFPGWWGASHQKRHVAVAKFVFVSDPNSATEALLNGEIQGEFQVPTVSLNRLRDSGGTLVNGPDTAIYALAQTSPTGIGQNRDIRQAISDLVDYTGFAKSQFQGTALITKSLADPATWGTEPDLYAAAYDKLPARSQDIAAARKLVKASGVKHPVVNIAETSVQQGVSELLNQLTQAGQQVGLTIVNKPLSVGQFGQLFTSAKARAPYAFMYIQQNADVADPLEFYSQMALPGGSENYSGYDNPTVTKLLKQANLSRSAKQRAELTVSAQKLITPDDSYIPLVAQYLATYVGPKIGGIQAALPSDLYRPWVADIGGR